MAAADIKLNDLLHLNNLENVKINFNMNNGVEDPLEVYKKDPDIINHHWLLYKGKDGRENFPVGSTMIGLVRLSEATDLWLLTTVATITESLPVEQDVGYKSEDLPEYAAYYGRVIVRFHNTAQQTRRKSEGIMDDIIVDQILPEILQDDSFPGYDKVRLNYDQLKQVIDHQKKDWVTALKYQKAVYLLTDTHTGKLYVGSATADNGMLLKRWGDYVANGHGGNVMLKELGFDYIKQNFQYSILETFKSGTDDATIVGRESWWKETLATRTFGYNKN